MGCPDRGLLDWIVLPRLPLRAQPATNVNEPFERRCITASPCLYALRFQNLDMTALLGIRYYDLRNNRSLVSLIGFLVLLTSAGCGLDILESVINPGDDESNLPDLRLTRVSSDTDAPGVFCNDGPTVLVAVENRGQQDAGESLTTFVFVPGGSVDVQTPEIGSDSSIQLSPVAVPRECFNPDCDFTILADSRFQVEESDEDNNRADGNCPASVVP